MGILERHSRQGLRLTPIALVALAAMGGGLHQARAAGASVAVAPASPDAESKLCHSTAEYIQTLKFLRASKEFAFQEVAARQVADDVSKGCDGAAQRFSQVLMLLKTVGVSETRCLQMALEFSRSPPDVQKNFIEIFTRAFLKEFFDFEYNKAMQLALALSKDFKGDARVEREDFISLTRFCKDPTALSLPIPFCAEYAVEVARLSPYFKNGVAKPFQEFYKSLRDKPGLTLDVKAALEMSFEVLKSGPRAPENFIQAFDFALADLKLGKKAALKFALNLAGHSFVGDKPPPLQSAATPAPPPASREAAPAAREP